MRSSEVVWLGAGGSVVNAVANSLEVKGCRLLAVKNVSGCCHCWSQDARPFDFSGIGVPVRKSFR